MFVLSRGAPGQCCQVKEFKGVKSCLERETTMKKENSVNSTKRENIQFRTM